MRLRERWMKAGLIGAASAGKDALDKNNANIVIFDSPHYGVTVVIARGKRAEELRAAFPTTDPE